VCHVFAAPPCRCQDPRNGKNPLAGFWWSGRPRDVWLTYLSGGAFWKHSERVLDASQAYGRCRAVGAVVCRGQLRWLIPTNSPYILPRRTRKRLRSRDIPCLEWQGRGQHRAVCWRSAVSGKLDAGGDRTACGRKEGLVRDPLFETAFCWQAKAARLGPARGKGAESVAAYGVGAKPAFCCGRKALPDRSVRSDVCGAADVAHAQSIWGRRRLKQPCSCGLVAARVFA